MAGETVATIVEAHRAGANPEATVARAFERAGGFHVVVLAVGVLGAQAGLDADRSTAIEVMRVNFLGAGSLLLAALAALRRQGHGTLIVLSTVAGERVRASNANGWKFSPAQAAPPPCSG